MDKPHVFIGPSIKLSEAKEILPEAYYHNPIRCGELIRLLRLNPKTVLIIDGCYEFTPAVWHKEIMLALDVGVRVIGGASMGALRASELHCIGMEGVGKIYQRFKSGELNDDDEVAVLHKSEEDEFVPINDAMVNIRETLDKARQQNIISPVSEKKLKEFCKAKFYPGRSLREAVSQVGLSKGEKERLTSWLDEFGMIDLKKQDAIESLKYLKELQEEPRGHESMPVTKFISHLIDYSFSTPFLKRYDFLPEDEKKLIELEKDNEHFYRLLTDLAIILKNLFVMSQTDRLSLNQDELNSFIKEENLYPLSDSFSYLKKHTVLSSLYDYLTQLVCLSGLTKEMVQSYLAEAKAFYLLNEEKDYDKAIEKVVVLMLLIEYQMREANIVLKKDSFLRGVGKMARSRGFDKEKTMSWLSQEGIDQTKLLSFLTIRQKINCLHQGIGDLIRRTDRDTPRYFKWIFDAINLSDVAS